MYWTDLQIEWWLILLKALEQIKLLEKKQHKYTASFKKSAINEVSQEEVAKNFCFTQSQVSR